MKFNCNHFPARQVDQWLEFAGSLAPGSTLEAACAVANEYLQLRTYLVGYRLSLADLACWGQLAGARTGSTAAVHFRRDDHRGLLACAHMML